MASFSRAMVVCSNLERSRQFYRTILELPLRVDASPGWIELDLGEGRALVLYATNDYLAVRPGSIQLGFTVADVDAFVNDARVAGVRILQDVYAQPAGRVATIADPDGYPIQVGTPA